VIPSHLWTQVFPHSLDPIPKYWFIHEETRLELQFYKDFSFTSKYPELELVLQKIEELIFTANHDKRSDFVEGPKHTQELQTKLHLPLIENLIEFY
jgi:hypothetical protein